VKFAEDIVSTAHGCSAWIDGAKVECGSSRNIVTEGRPPSRSVLPHGFYKNESGVLTFELTPEEQREIRSTFDAFKGYVIHPRYLGELRSALTACALGNYAVSCAWMDQPEGAFAALSKAYSYYRLPIYLYGAACLLDKIGRAKDATELFRKFLERQSTFQPTALQELILQDRDIPEAVKDANTKLR
jgi:hypothetical protein